MFGTPGVSRHNVIRRQTRPPLGPATIRLDAPFVAVGSMRAVLRLGLSLRSPFVGAGLMEAVLASVPAGGGSYTNPGGSGDRTASLPVTTTLTGGRTDVVGNAVDGAFGNNVFDGFWAADQASVGLEIKFNLSSYGTKTIERIKWYQQDANGHGVWQPQYSPNGSTWTNAGSTINLGGATVSEYIFTSPGAGQWFRLLGVSGNFNSNPWIQEVEFYITA